MRTKVILFLRIVILSVLLSACADKNNVHIDEFKYKVDIRDALNESVDSINLSSYFNRIRYVSLETNSESLLDRVRFLEITNDFIFVSDSRILLQFDSEGRFIRQISNLGKGPREHGRNLKFKVDESNLEIFLHSSPSKMLVFDINTGEFKRSFNVNLEVANFDIQEEDKRLVFFTKELSSHTSRSSINEVCLTDYSGNMLDSIKDNKRLDNQNNVIGYVHLYSKGPDKYFMGCYKDKLFKVNTEFNKEPYVRFNLGNSIEWNKLIIEPGMDNKLADFVTILNPLELKDKLFLSVQVGIPPVKKGHSEKFVFNKTTSELIHTADMKNDLDGGLPFWPQFVKENKLIASYNAYEIIEYFDRMDLEINSTSFNDIVRNLNEQSNPIIVIVE